VKSKTPLVLMELLVMVLVFALAAALCLQCFVLSDRLSQRSELRDEAVTAVQNAAERLKARGGSYEQAVSGLSGTWADGALAIPGDGFTLRITPVDSAVPLLVQAEISAYSHEDDSLLFQIVAAWQEVSGHE